MKLTLLIGGVVGYILGTRAGHERYEQIVRASRRLAGSQTVQSAAGVLQAQVTDLTQRVKGTVANRVGATSAEPSPNGAAAPIH